MILAGRSDPFDTSRAPAPAVRGAIVSRRGLFERLDRAARVTQISAPAGNPAAAGRALEQALDLVEPDGALFAFVLHPAPELLQRHARRGTSHAALIAEILSLLARPGPEGYEGMASSSHERWGLERSSSRLTEPLTGSETRVLRFLPTNLSAPQISGQLCVSVNTVRTHMRHVYEKLGAHSRADAVERARVLGLLAPSAGRP